MRGEWNPSGLRGLMLVTFFAAFMSTISTQMNWGASYLVRDVYQRFVSPDAEERQLTLVSRCVSLLVLLVGGLVSAWMIRSGVSIDEAWKLLLALGAGTGAVFMLRWFWWRINAWSEISAMAASLIYFSTIDQILVTQNEVGETVPWLASEEKMLVVALATIITWLIVTLATKPESMKTLETFYRKVRPGGPGWKKVAAIAPDVQVDSQLGLSVVTSVVASGIVYFTIPAIGCFIFGRLLDGFLLATGTFICTGSVLYLMRLINRGSVSASNGEDQIEF